MKMVIMWGQKDSEEWRKEVGINKDDYRKQLMAE